MERLFEEWIASYPVDLRVGFHRDGIVSEECYAKQTKRVLFVLLEPNSTGGNYEKYKGWDLRRVWGEVGLAKPVDYNLARWTRVILDGITEYFKAGRESAMRELWRVAIINLKKLSGSGTANIEAIRASNGQVQRRTPLNPPLERGEAPLHLCVKRSSVQAWRDRSFIRNQVELIEPEFIVTCGTTVNRLFGWIVNDDPCRDSPIDCVWSHHGRSILPIENHSSLRPKDAERAFQRVVERNLMLKTSPTLSS